jgi:hypothetical protein
VTLVAMTGREQSTLAQHADIVLSSAVRPGGLPAEPRAHRQHHGADGAGRRAGGGAAGCARLRGGGLRALAPRRQPRAQAARCTCATSCAAATRVPVVGPDAPLPRDAARDERAAAWASRR